MKRTNRCVIYREHRIRTGVMLTGRCEAQYVKGYLDCSFANKGKVACKYRAHSVPWSSLSGICNNPLAIAEAVKEQVLP